MTTPEDKPVEQTPEEKATAEAAEETELFDAVSGAIDEVTITPEKKDDDTTELENNESGDGGDDDTAPVESSSDTGAADNEGDEEKPPVGEPKDKDATDVDGETPGDEGGDDAPKKDDKPGDDTPGGDEPSPELDPLNDPIPESTNEKTAERIKSLIGLVKSSNESVGQRDEILEQITQTGTDADQYANTLGFLKLYNSKDTGERKQALEVARGLVKELALELGEGSTVTKLSDHEDLSAEVEAGTLSEARALEIAATREADKLRTAKDEATATAATTESTTQQNLATGKAQLDVFETAARADENYAKIRPQFIKLLGPILKRTHPADWGAAAQEVYDQVKTFTPAAAPKPKPKNTPIRPKQGAGADGQTSDDDTALGAVDAALANM